jgi:hypothetical protein
MASNAIGRNRRQYRSNSTDSHASVEPDFNYDNEVATPHPTTVSMEGEEDDSEDVRMAIAALGIMRSGSISSANHSLSNSVHHNSARSGPSTEANTSFGSTGPSSITSAQTSTAPSEAGGDIQQVLDPTFISRVSQLPLVSGGLEWYSRSKQASPLVKVSHPDFFNFSS